MLLLNYAHIKIAVGQLLLDILEPDYTHLLCTDGSVIFVCSLPAAQDLITPAPYRAVCVSNSPPENLHRPLGNSQRSLIACPSHKFFIPTFGTSYQIFGLFSLVV